ncbi:nucleoside 2-deoxyribosyltransferase [Pseudomonas sp. URMO17WK12:I1]|uniref:nucleoside 2-deoxyribosyltransferase n=1 Tax=unclassified Pseudomonas TaxID=196821 RepID=UPI00048424A4|nr:MULTISPECIES: nucleoside 2-deoxyribosyltransferase [unclassified Pseudomonas]PZW69640.1 nucleoside 2-deoxyribosyltransferase [Pseudomonas sp. URMO17WK12:I1]
MSTAGQPKVYLAGFDVFRADAVEHGEYLKRLCREQGLEGLYPFDNEVAEGLAPAALAAQICRLNLAMIREADAVLANLNLFRGFEPDSGTAFEVGAAVALGKPVWAYFEPQGSMRQWLPGDENGRDADGYFIEDFGLPRNLMLACSWAGCSASVEEGVAALRRYLSGASRA